MLPACACKSWTLLFRSGPPEGRASQLPCTRRTDSSRAAPLAVVLRPCARSSCPLPWRRSPCSKAGAGRPSQQWPLAPLLTPGGGAAAACRGGAAGGGRPLSSRARSSSCPLQCTGRRRLVDGAAWLQPVYGQPLPLRYHPAAAGAGGAAGGAGGCGLESAARRRRRGR